MTATTSSYKNNISNSNNPFRRFSCSNFNRLLFTAGTDFVMHNTTAFQSADNPIADAIWSFAHKNFVLYLVSDPSSSFRIRQAAASALHFNRFATNLFISAADYSFMSIFDFIFFNKSKSWSQGSKKRAFKRLMLTLRRNGGVYAELFELIEPFASSDPIYDDILKKAPFNRYNEERENDLAISYGITRKEASQIIKKELGSSLGRYFIDFPIHPTSMRNEISMFDCTLKSGERVTVSIFPPHLQRMRRYDLFPFYVIRSILNIIPSAYSLGFRPFKNSTKSSLRRRKLHKIFRNSSSQLRLDFDAAKSLFDAIVERLDNNLVKEAKSRMKILNGLAGIDFTMPNSIISKRYKRSIDSNRIPIAVPPPFPNLCSDHVMVTLVEQHSHMQKVTMKTNLNLAKFTSLLYKKTQSFVPRLGISNLRCDSVDDNELVSLASYASLTRIDSNKMKIICGLYSYMLSNDKENAYFYARQLDVPSEIASDILRMNRRNKILPKFLQSPSNTQKMLKSMTVALLPRNSSVALAGSEAIFALGGQFTRATTKAKRSAISTAEAINSAVKEFVNSIVD